MTETKTVELPLTRSEQRHLDNTRRRDEKRRRAVARDDSREQRDAKLAAINEDFGPRILKLQDQRKAALAKVWEEWKAERRAA